MFGGRREGEDRARPLRPAQEGRRRRGLRDRRGVRHARPREGDAPLRGRGIGRGHPQQAEGARLHLASVPDVRASSNDHEPRSSTCCWRPFGHRAAAFDLLLWPVSMGFVALLIVKAVSNQKAIANAKQQIAMRLLEIRLFQHDLGQRAPLDARDPLEEHPLRRQQRPADARDDRSDARRAHAARRELRVRARAVGRRRGLARRARARARSACRSRSSSRRRGARRTARPHRGRTRVLAAAIASGWRPCADASRSAASRSRRSGPSAARRGRFRRNGCAGSRRSSTRARTRSPLVGRRADRDRHAARSRAPLFSRTAREASSRWFFVLSLVAGFALKDVVGVTL